MLNPEQGWTDSSPLNIFDSPKPTDVFYYIVCVHTLEYIFVTAANIVNTVLM